MENFLKDILMQDFHFLRPMWLLATFPILVFIAALWRLNSSTTAWDKAIDKTLLPFLIDKKKHSSQKTPLLLLTLLWLLCTLALSGPVWEKLPQPVQQREDALVIVLDLSLSMFAPDHDPSRLDLAKRKLRDVLELRSEGQTALVVYAGDAHTVTPLTDDVVTITALVPSLSPNIMPLFGSNPVLAINQAIQLLDTAGAPRGKILLMTDGIKSGREESAVVGLFEDNDYELLVMGIGTEAGAPIRVNDGGYLTDNSGQRVVAKLDREPLMSVVERTGGKYHDIQLADSDLAYLLTEAINIDDEELSDSEEEFDIWFETGPWLLLLILPITAMSFRRGWLFNIAFLATLPCLTLTSQPIEAAGWIDLWLRADQQGAKAFQNNDHTEASNLFSSRDWAGAAAYRAGDYETAAADFATIETPDGHYNRGNALAVAGNYEQAIAAYEITLNAEPEHEEALQNKAIVEQLLEQENQESAEQDSGENENSESQQNSEDESEQQDENSDQQDQESQEGNQDQQQQEQQSEAPDEQEASESNSEQNTPSDTTNEEFEEQQALEQWLRRIDDDPGELLRRKFRYQYRQRQLNGTANSTQGGGQIW